MAELNQKSTTPVNKKHRTRKVAPKVDLTAMVDLAFLLITFFMLTTSLNKAHSLDVAMPSNEQESTIDMDERRIISLLIAEGQASWYHGNFSNPISPPESVSLQSSELRTVLGKMKNQIPILTGGKDMVVLIKPGKEARTADIIHTLDELKVSDIKRYIISKISSEEEGSLPTVL
ncbi:MAG TPA: biopolymer transporter ExbD [Sphingobacterium sp.]|nr:biopolymer transporter ExbD [Sphingobacterium sp.]